MWIDGHTHTHPDDTHSNEGHVETKWGVNFSNVGALTKYQGVLSTPMSRQLSVTDGSKQIDVRCFLYPSFYELQGWYDTATRTIELPKSVWLPSK